MALSKQMETEKYWIATQFKKNLRTVFKYYFHFPSCCAQPLFQIARADFACLSYPKQNPCLLETVIVIIGHDLESLVLHNPPQNYEGLYNSDVVYIEVPAP